MKLNLDCTREEFAQYLRDLAHAIEKNKIVLECEDEQEVYSPPDTSLKLACKAMERGETQRLKVKVQWYDLGEENLFYDLAETLSPPTKVKSCKDCAEKKPSKRCKTCPLNE